MATLVKRSAVPNRKFKAWNHRSVDGGPIKCQGIMFLEEDGLLSLETGGFDMQVEVNEWMDALALIVDAGEEHEVRLDIGVCLYFERYGILRRKQRVVIEEFGHIKLASFDLEDMQKRVSELLVEAALEVGNSSR